MKRGACVLFGLGVLLASAPAAHAAEPVGEKFPDADAPLGVLPVPDDALIDPKMARSWGALPARPFVATTFDFGFVYFRPRVSFGYGRPFTNWVGVDANVVGQTAGLGAYGGFRVEIPHMDWRIGPRFFRSFEHTYLDRKPSYARIDFEREFTTTPASTLTLESEVDFGFTLGPGKLLLRGSVSYVTGVPEGKDVFEETLHVIVTPPWVWRARLGYAFTFGSHDQHSLGPAVDVLHVPGRSDSETVRAGPILRMALSRRVDVRGSFIATIISPDRIGLRGGDFTELGLRYRWASE
jgi:hypothetical protein